jgi:hypothetical protein
MTRATPQGEPSPGTAGSRLLFRHRRPIPAFRSRLSCWSNANETEIAMSSVLTIGALDDVLVDGVDEVLAQIGAGSATDWQRYTDQAEVISLLNMASVNPFNAFAAGLEGTTGYDAMDRTRLKNLPWWLDAVWLPVEINPPAISISGDPVFVGSVQRLKTELEDIQRLAGTLNLGTAPDEYVRMRKSYDAWWRDVNEAEPEDLSEDDTLRWIWRALYDGIEMATAKNIPMFWFGG